MVALMWHSTMVALMFGEHYKLHLLLDLFKTQLIRAFQFCVVSLSFLPLLQLGLPLLNCPVISKVTGCLFWGGEILSKTDLHVMMDEMMNDE